MFFYRQSSGNVNFCQSTIKWLQHYYEHTGFYILTVQTCSRSQLQICYSGADPGFVGPEAYKNFEALFKKKNTKLRIQNEARK